MTTPATLRRRVLFFGRVQGVGFRATTASIARQFTVTGLVSNLPDGSVELIAEGTVSELERFVQAIEEALPRNITSREVHDSSARGEFDRFMIDH